MPFTQQDAFKVWHRRQNGKGRSVSMPFTQQDAFKDYSQESCVQGSWSLNAVHTARCFQSPTRCSYKRSWWGCLNAVHTARCFQRNMSMWWSRRPSWVSMPFTQQDAFKVENLHLVSMRGESQCRSHSKMLSKKELRERQSQMSDESQCRSHSKMLSKKSCLYPSQISNMSQCRSHSKMLSKRRKSCLYPSQICLNAVHTARCFQRRGKTLKCIEHIMSQCRSHSKMLSKR